MQLLIAPDKTSVQPGNVTVFLAGSIEMDKAERWQEAVTNHLSQHPSADSITVFNPRREAWDASWKQTAENPVFNEQVTWELQNLEAAEIAFFYFQPDTLAPISLLELGKVSSMPKSARTVVVCPDGFWRKGNIEVLCNRNQMVLCNTLEEGIRFLDLIIFLHRTQGK